MKRRPKGDLPETEYPFQFGKVRVIAEPAVQEVLDKAMLSGQPPPARSKGIMWIKYWIENRPVSKMVHSPLQAFNFMRSLDGIDIISSELSNGRLYLLANGVVIKQWGWPSSVVTEEDRSMVHELARIAGASEEELQTFLKAQQAEEE